MRSVSSLRLGFVTWGNPEDPTVFSGTPVALIGALREFVGEVVPLSLTPPPRVAAGARRAGALGRVAVELRDLRGARARLSVVGQHSRPWRAASACAARTRLRRVGRLDSLIHIGGELPAPVGTPMVTVQDSTLVQAVRAYPWPHLEGLGPRQVARNVRWQRAVYASASACCGMSHWVADSLRDDYGIAPERVHVVGVGATHQPRAVAARDWSSPRFLFVGAEWQRKNGAGVLEAFAAVRALVPHATLDLVGDHPPVDQPGVRGHGWLTLDSDRDRAQMSQLLATATVLVMPSLHEPVGIAYVEAGAAGIPAIGSTNGGAATFLDGVGRMIDPTTTGALTDVMVELCSADLARDLGARARERAALFTWRKVAERLVRACSLPDVDVSQLTEFL